jgi:hypothetical protein
MPSIRTETHRLSRHAAGHEQATAPGVCKGVVATIGLCAMAVVLGCGSDGGGASPPRHPDTGAGASQTVPATVNCADACQRLSDCLIILCAEDTGNALPASAGSLITYNCEMTCVEASLQAVSTPDSWRCYFQSSCRQVFADDVCAMKASYHCN